MNAEELDPRACVGGQVISTWEPLEVVEVMGTDARGFLQGQLSQDLLGGLPSEGAWSLLLEPDGLLGHLVRVCSPTEERVLVVGAAGQAGAIAERLSRFKIRVAAAISVRTMGLVLGDAPEGRSVVPLVSFHPDVTQWLSEAAPRSADPLFAPAGFSDSYGLVLGALTSQDVHPGMNPFELGASAISQAVSFTKGCYTGQELVARVDARAGSAPFWLCHLTGVGLGGGSLTVEGEEVGEIVRCGIDGTTSVGYATARVKRKVDATESFQGFVGSAAVTGRALLRS